MIEDATVSTRRDAVLADVDFLTRSATRIDVLLAVTAAPRTPDELSAVIGVSSSTIRRTLRAFETRSWVRKTDGHYEATQLGAFVATTMTELVERFETERTLRNVWDWLPGSADGLTMEMCAEATVTMADSTVPYRPVRRFSSLLANAASIRFVGLDVALLDASTDTFFEGISNGMAVELVIQPRVTRYVETHCPHLFGDGFQYESIDVWLHEDLPLYGAGLLDDRAVLCGYDRDGVAVRVVLDTDRPALVDWVEQIVTDYRRESTPISIESIES